MIITGDCLEVMKTLETASIDAIVTDPPYGLSFMGKNWDRLVPGVAFWREALRVAKPGCHILAAGGSRTYHRLAVAIEDAGWEIRDCIMWIYGSGFPKSHNLKDEWQGWGTALKPAFEPFILARKPLDGTVAQNVQRHGCGGLNVDGCRVGSEKRIAFQSGTPGAGRMRACNLVDRGDGKTPDGRCLKTALEYVKKSKTGEPKEHIGRWPANVIHDGSDEVLAGFENTEKYNRPGGRRIKTGGIRGTEHLSGLKGSHETRCFDDTGSAARFFYCPKASKSEREAGLDGMKSIDRVNGNKWTDEDYRVKNGERPPSAESGPRTNHHPTVKPVDLIAYLCRLITPPNGTILDPFCGSGSTGVAAIREGFNFIGIELNPDYAEIATRRIEHERSRTPLLEAIK